MRYTLLISVCSLLLFIPSSALLWKCQLLFTPNFNVLAAKLRKNIMVLVWEETYDSGTVAFITLCTALVFIMVPGLGFLYSGLARRKSALSLIWTVLMACVVGFVQWYFWGYSLAFSSTATNGFIGNLDSFGLRNIYASEDADYPEFAFAIFQNMFLCVTLAIISGATAERGRVLPHMVFLFFWATLVYCPLACWVWNPSGWAFKWGALDYAGGCAVEIGSGVGGFVYSWFLGKRKEKLLINFRPHNVSLVTLGTSLLWFGWLGFNGGTALLPNLKPIYAIMNTNLTASFAAMTWCVLDYRLEKKWSTVGLCSGLISGLVAATPASGCIPLYGSVVLGIVTGVVCNFSTGIKYLVGVDDALDILAEHGIAGILGLFFNALFGADWVIGMDGVSEHDGGFISHNYKQIYIQIAIIGAAVGYTAVVTAIICFILDKIPGLKLRANEEGEAKGMDEDQIGEFAYDYVEVRRDFLSWGSGHNDHIPQVIDQQDQSTTETPPGVGEEKTES
jgi:Amt family ammonium transporter